MSSVSPSYSPGAVVNGHYLASDYNWYPVPVQPQIVVAPANNGGVTTALWIIIAILTVPVWIWFTPILIVAGLVWLFGWFEMNLYRSAFRSYGWVGVSVLSAVQVGAVAVAAWRIF